MSYEKCTGRERGIKIDKEMGKEMGKGRRRGGWRRKREREKGAWMMIDGSTGDRKKGMR